ncbi:LytR/AlgR family response regulator transcription factor [Pedobacter jeongneungensis]|uniref:LytR/AlgR family response regulator transcription factor n=1 Tax=Pedobacter jeongneungensis TaxID=947309 RepID=UPI0004688BDF|nr:LytTR family DNA-binding domain-containing protein [Pedobacter jeongneungensis]
MINIGIYIVDDSEAAISLLSLYIKNTPGTHLVGSQTHPEIALEEILSRKIKPDLVFLDIEMPVLKGTEMANELKNITLIVFVTAHKDHGPEAYEHGVVDYVMKPFGYERFLKAINRVRVKLEEQEKGKKQFLIIPGDGRASSFQIPKAEVRYIKGSSNYVEVYTESRKYLSFILLKEIDKLLIDDRQFIRVQKSYIINLDFMERYDTLHIYIGGGKLIGIGKIYKVEFLNRVKQR